MENGMQVSGKWLCTGDIGDEGGCGGEQGKDGVERVWKVGEECWADESINVELHSNKIIWKIFMNCECQWQVLHAFWFIPFCYSSKNNIYTHTHKLIIVQTRRYKFVTQTARHHFILAHHT